MSGQSGAPRGIPLGLVLIRNYNSCKGNTIYRLDETISIPVLYS